MENVGAVLKTIRKRRKLSQRKLARELNLSQREISYVDQGQRQNSTTLGRLLQSYKLSEDEIEELIWSEVSDFLVSVGLPNSLAEKIKAEHSLMRCYGRGTRIKKLLTSFKEGVPDVLQI